MPDPGQVAAELRAWSAARRALAWTHPARGRSLRHLGLGDDNLFRLSDELQPQVSFAFALP